MKIILIRHAENSGDPFETPGRSARGFLSKKKGVGQALKLRKSLDTEKIDVVLCSTLGRAIETAEIAMGKRKIKFVLCDFLKEWMPNPELESLADTKHEAILQQNKDKHAEETWKTDLGEGAFDMMARICPPFLEELKKLGIHSKFGGFVPSDKGEKLTVAVFAHGGSLNVLLSFLLELRPFPVGRFSFALTGVAEIEFTEMNGIFYPHLKIPAPH